MDSANRLRAAVKVAASIIGRGNPTSTQKALDLLAGAVLPAERQEAHPLAAAVVKAAAVQTDAEAQTILLDALGAPTFSGFPFDAPDPEAIIKPGPPIYGDSLLAVGEVGIFSGPGGAGKSTALLGLMQSARPGVTGADDWGDALNLRIRRGPMVYLSYEDSAVRLKRRALWFGRRDDWSHVTLASSVGPLWAADTTDRRVSGPGQSWDAFWAGVTEAGARLVVLDPASVAFAGASPNDGAAVRAFLLAVSREAQAANCAVLIVAHDTKASRVSARKGEGFDAAGAVSGSAQWVDGARAMLHLSGSFAGLPPEHRMLVVAKSNYCRTGWGALLAPRVDENGGNWRGLQTVQALTKERVNEVVERKTPMEPPGQESGVDGDDLGW